MFLSSSTKENNFSTIFKETCLSSLDWGLLNLVTGVWSILLIIPLVRASTTFLSRAEKSGPILLSAFCNSSFLINSKSDLSLLITGTASKLAHHSRKMILSSSTKDSASFAIFCLNSWFLETTSCKSSTSNHLMLTTYKRSFPEIKNLDRK